MTTPNEVEIKLRLDPNQAKRLESWSELAGADPSIKNYHTVYFDDEERHLFKNGYELRVRQDGEHSIQTLKTVDSIDRGEWENETADGDPSLESVKAPGVAKLAKHGIALRPIFSLDVDRRTWSLSRNGSHIEVALDNGAFNAVGRQRPICEAELELKSGEAEIIFELAQKMSEETGAIPSFASKGARGYRLAEDEADAPARGLVLHLDDDVLVENAFQRICDACLKQFSLNEEILHTTIESEAVHQARVATRRLRAAFTMFKDVVVGEDADAARRELKWLSDVLGEARDLDVFLESRMNAIALQHPDVAGVKELTQRLEAMRDRARRRLVDALHSERIRALLLRVARCAHNGDWRRNHGELFIEFARDALDRRLNSVKKKRKAVRGLDMRKRHRLRIKAKKLRYMLEFLKPIASRKALGAVTDRLERLQDLLGALNDAIAGERLLGRLVEEARSPAVGFAADLVRTTLAPSPKLACKAIETHDDLRRMPSLAHV